MQLAFKLISTLDALNNNSLRFHTKQFEMSKTEVVPMLSIFIARKC